MWSHVFLSGAFEVHFAPVSTPRAMGELRVEVYDKDKVRTLGRSTLVVNNLLRHLNTYINNILTPHTLLP